MAVVGSVVVLDEVLVVRDWGPRGMAPPLRPGRWDPTPRGGLGPVRERRSPPPPSPRSRHLIARAGPRQAQPRLVLLAGEQRLLQPRQHPLPPTPDKGRYTSGEGRYTPVTVGYAPAGSYAQAKADCGEKIIGKRL